ncbi:MAG TPA: hypothetical protein DD490_25305 [Acidobacteria bacterium]|nr:hypothetical protein [Acidobacteriota bacterium]
MFWRLNAGTRVRFRDRRVPGQEAGRCQAKTGLIDDPPGLVVFNVSGNRYRLIAAVHFNRKRVYVRHVLTHEEYDQGEWKP